MNWKEKVNVFHVAVADFTSDDLALFSISVSSNIVEP